MLSSSSRNGLSAVEAACFPNRRNSAFVSPPRRGVGSESLERPTLTPPGTRAREGGSPLRGADHAPPCDRLFLDAAHQEAVVEGELGRQGHRQYMPPPAGI